MSNKGPSRRVPRVSPRTSSEPASTSRRPATVRVTDGIVTDYGAMRRSMEALVEGSDVARALRSVDPMEH